MATRNTLRGSWASLIASMALCAGFHGVAAADDAPGTAPPAGEEGPTGRHHNPAWAACRKKAEDQKLAPGDARREFMRDCLKASQPPAPAPAT